MYNPVIKNTSIFDTKILEYKAWYTGDPNILMQFYKLNSQHSNSSINFSAEDSFYWKRVRNSNLKRHIPLASAISEAMADLLFSNGIKVAETSIDLPIEEMNRRNDLLNNIINNNQMASRYAEGAEYESWSGHVAYKLIFDNNVSNVPIIQVYSADKFEVIKEHNTTIAIIFKDYFVYDKNSYCLYEIYGKGFIKYELYCKKINEKDYKMVNLLDTPKTENLQDVHFVKSRTESIINENGETVIEIHDDNIDVIFAVEKPNKLPNVLFDNNWAGRSDYAGLETEFDGLDESQNAIDDLVRRGKLKRYGNLDTHILDSQGNSSGIDNFDNDIEVIGDTGREESGASIVMQEPNLNAIKNLEISKNQKQIDILSRVKLSPSTLGIDIAGAEASGASIREREKASLRTRNAKIELWRPALIELYKKALLLDDLINGLVNVEENKELTRYNITIEFNDYVVPTLEERVETMDKAILGKTVDIKTAVEQVWAGKSDEEIDLIVSNIKKENNIANIE